MGSHIISTTAVGIEAITFFIAGWTVLGIGASKRKVKLDSKGKIISDIKELQS